MGSITFITCDGCDNILTPGDRVFFGTLGTLDTTTDDGNTYEAVINESEDPDDSCVYCAACAAGIAATLRKAED